MTTTRVLFAALPLGLAGQCQTPPPATATGIDPSRVQPDAVCALQYEPVGGGGNACVAAHAGGRAHAPGSCPAPAPK